MSAKYDQLLRLLRELFQLDHPELDFGLYRIMHAKSEEITKFLDEELLPQVADALGAYKSADKSKIEEELGQAIENAEKLEVDPETLPKIQELRAKLKDESMDLRQVEGRIYEHLFQFFRRYYERGDFVSKRLYKKGVYALPYEGEEVVLHWANKEHFYTKTSEYLRDYSFYLRPHNAGDKMRVRFKLLGAEEGEHGNVKESNDKGRVFLLARQGEADSKFIELKDGELHIYFEYRPARTEDWTEEQKDKATAAAKKKPPSQEALLQQASQAILLRQDESLKDWLYQLRLPRESKRKGGEELTCLGIHLQRLVARNTFDYFIHRDLDGFLRRELDYYIKNEVMHLDDIENVSSERVEKYLSVIGVIRKIAGKIIEFLAQLEEFQKKLWLKKKFVVEANYCLTLDQIPEKFYGEIAANEAQKAEWVELFGIDKIESDLGRVGYDRDLSVDFLRQNQSLPVDTRHFKPSFTHELLTSMESTEVFDRHLLVHGDNFQALRLLEAKYSQKVQAVYIDPPYNTGEDEFVYRDNYRHSTWLTMMNQTAQAASLLLDSNGSFLCSIDDEEVCPLRLLLEQFFGKEAFVAQIAYERSGSSGLGQGGKIVNTKEHILAYSLQKAELNDVYYRRPIERETLKRYTQIMVNPGNREEVSSFIASSTGEKVTIYRHSDEELSSISLRSFEKRKDEIEAQYLEHFESIFRLTSVQKENEFQNRILSKCKNGLYSADYLAARGRNGGKKVTYYYKDGQIFAWLKDSARRKGGQILKENKITDHWSHGEIPKADLANEGGVTLRRGKKPEQLIKRLIEWSSEANDLVLDYFAGSGTTAATALKLGRGFVSVDNERYFDQKSLRRLKRVLYGEKTGITGSVGWKGGGAFKYLRLESYEDTLNNLKLERSSDQDALLESDDAGGVGGFREQYQLRYMLESEAAGSASLLNTTTFMQPEAYDLEVKIPGQEESRLRSVDLVETFNYLVGLKDCSYWGPERVNAEFVRDNEKRLQVDGGLKVSNTGDYWFRAVTGNARMDTVELKVLIIWRTLTGDWEKDNLVLNEWFNRKDWKEHRSGLKRVYVNGSSTLESTKSQKENWNLVLLEDAFARLMFEV